MKRIMARLKPAWRWIMRVCTPSDAAWGAAAWGLIGCWVFIFLSFLLHDVVPDFAVGKEPENAPLDWTVVLVDATGAEARVPLSRDQVLYPQIKGQTRRFPEIDGAKMAEVVMLRYRLPLADFAAANPKLDLARPIVVRLDFDRSKRGAIVLDNVGIAPG